jgi:hypothetical protein
MSSNSLQLGTHLRQRRKVEVAGNVKPRALLNKLLYKPARQHPFYRLTDTDWQAHSVRGFISGTLGKKMGLTLLSTKGENGERTYSIQS